MTTAAPPPGNATGPSVGALEPDINTIGTGSDDGRESTSSQARTPADRAGQRVPETGDSQVAPLANEIAEHAAAMMLAGYVVGDLDSAAALDAAGFLAACPTDPHQLQLLLDGARLEGAVVFVGAVPSGLREHVVDLLLTRDLLPTRDRLYSLPLPPGCQTVCDALGVAVGGGEIWSERTKLAKNATWAAWARENARMLDAPASEIAAENASVDGTGCLAGPEPEEEPPPPSPIRTLWRPTQPGLMRTKPPPRRYLLRHPTRDGNPCPPGEGDGLMPRGKAGLFVAEGGAGKTLAVMAMAVCLVTGRPWLGHYPVDPTARGDVLLLLGEEDPDEVHRRLYTIGAALQLTDAEHAEVERRVIAIPLAGESTPFLELGMRRDIMVTHHFAELRQMLHDEAPADGWSLVVVDPLSRFAGLPIDLDNLAATRVVQAIESLVRVPGNPTMLALHHSSKDARKNGTVDARGATGLTDGVRWVAGLTCREGGTVEFQQTKSNYSRPMLVPLQLDRGPEGVLVAKAEQVTSATPNLLIRAQERQLRVIETLRSIGGRTHRVGTVTELLPPPVKQWEVAFAGAVDSGRILRKKVKGQREFWLPDLDLPDLDEAPQAPPDMPSGGAEGGRAHPLKGDGRPPRPPAFLSIDSGPLGAPLAPPAPPAGVDEGQPERPKGGKRKPRLVKP